MTIKLNNGYKYRGISAKNWGPGRIFRFRKVVYSVKLANWMEVVLVKRKSRYKFVNLINTAVNAFQYVKTSLL